jgi:hypothetical protein
MGNMAAPQQRGGLNGAQLNRAKKHQELTGKKREEPRTDWMMVRGSRAARPGGLLKHASFWAEIQAIGVGAGRA